MKYNETKYWASFKSFNTNRNIVYLHPQKEQIRLFTRLNSSCDDSLRSTPASEKWAEMYPSIFKIRFEQSIDKAVELIIRSHKEDNRKEAEKTDGIEYV